MEALLTFEKPLTRSCGPTSSSRTASGNQVSGSSTNGILLGASGATLTNNRIVSSATAAVEFGCFTASVNGNFINDAPVGFDAAAGPIPTINTIDNTATTITNGCAVTAATALRTAATLGMATRTNANPAEQWHTPATPYGARTK